MARSDAQWIRLYARRAKKMLGKALAGKPESENNHLPPPETPEDVGRYKELQESADAIVAHVDESKPLPFHLVFEYGFLHHINTGWGYQRTQPLLGVQKRWRTNRDAANAKRRETAAEVARAELAKWREQRPELSAKAAVDGFPCGRRKFERLKKDLVAGLIPEK